MKPAPAATSSEPHPEPGHPAEPAASPDPLPGPWAAVRANREHRGLWPAYALTLAGDQLARVALILLVYAATHSPTAAALAYAVTLIPELVGGPLLAGLADRYPRRTVMVSCDAASAVLIAVVAVPGLPLPVMLALVCAVALLAAPFGAARSALVRDVFPDQGHYAAASTLAALTSRTAYTLGLVAGGVLVATIGPRPALLLDAVTFAASALLVRTSVATRPAATSGQPRGRYSAELRAGIRLVFRNPRLRRLTLYAWLAAFHVVPFGVVAPLVDQHGSGPVAVGCLLAAITAGAGTSMTLITTRIPDPDRQTRLMAPLAVLAAAPLTLCAVDPPLLLVGLLWALSGAGTGYQLIANIAFVTAVPNQRRSQAFGLVSAGLLAGQGGALLTAGALAELADPAHVIAAAGLAGTLAALTLATHDRRSTDTATAVSS